MLQILVTSFILCRLQLAIYLFRAGYSVRYRVFNKQSLRLCSRLPHCLCYISLMLPSEYQFSRRLVTAPSPLSQSDLCFFGQAKKAVGGSGAAASAPLRVGELIPRKEPTMKEIKSKAKAMEPGASTKKGSGDNFQAYRLVARRDDGSVQDQCIFVAFSPEQAAVLANALAQAKHNTNS